MPDSIVFSAGGHEVKGMGCKPHPLQLVGHEMLRRLGIKVYASDNEQQKLDVRADIIEAAGGTLSPLNLWQRPSWNTDHTVSETCESLSGLSLCDVLKLDPYEGIPQAVRRKFLTL